jgi:hypothetical protein
MQTTTYFNNSPSIPLTMEQQYYYAMQQHAMQQQQYHQQQQFAQLQYQQQQQAYAHAAQQQAQFLYAQAQAAQESSNLAQSHMLAQQTFVYAESRRLELRAVADKALEAAQELERTTNAPSCTCKPKCKGICRYRHCRHFFGPAKFCRNGESCEHLHYRAECVEDAFAAAAEAEAAAANATVAATVAAADLAGKQLPAAAGKYAEPQAVPRATTLKSSAPEWSPASDQTPSNGAAVGVAAAPEEWTAACAAVAANPLDAFLQSMGIVLDTTHANDDAGSVATIEGSVHGDADESHSVRSGQ